LFRSLAASVSALSGCVSKDGQTMQHVSSSLSKIPYVGFSSGNRSDFFVCINLTFAFSFEPEVNFEIVEPGHSWVDSFCLEFLR